MNTKTTLVLVAAACSAATFFLWPSRSDTHEQRVQLTANDHAFSFVKSLNGTDVDGDIKQNADGNLIVSSELRRLFDYYLSAMGEKNLPEIQGQIDKILDQKLPALAARQAKQLLVQYIAYKKALVGLEQDGATKTQASDTLLTSVRNRWQRMHQLRAQFFSEKEIQAMFGFDDAYDQDALERMAIDQDATLTGAQKKEKLAALDAAMSPELREAKSAPYQVVRLQEQTEKMRRDGASEDDIYRLRAAATSPEAANRLAEVDRETNDWNARIQRYVNQRQQLGLASSDTLTPEQQTQLQQLRNTMFTAQEQKRLPAYE